jgi:hypothetical protein
MSTNASDALFVLLIHVGLKTNLTEQLFFTGKSAAASPTPPKEFAWNLHVLDL